MSVMKNKKNIYLHDILKVVYIAIPALFFSFLIHYSGILFSQYVNENIEFKKIKNGHWISNLKSLLPGEYYISLGRPRSLCSIYFNRKLMNSNFSEKFSKREKLSLGSSFYIETKGDHIIEIICKTPQGFPVYLTSEPIIAERNIGLILQFYREFTQIFLGPLAAFLLFFYLGFNYISHLKLNYEKHKKNQAIIFINFSLISIFYSLSLSYFPRLWIDSVNSFYLHILIRSIFALFFCRLCSVYIENSKFLINLHVFQFVLQLGIIIIIPELALKFYSLSFCFFIFSTAVQSFKLIRKKRLKKTERLFLMLTTALTILQPIDYAATFILGTENIAPSLISILSVGLIYLKIYEQIVNRITDSATKEILTIIESSDLEIKNILVQISNVALNYSDFNSGSVFIDSFLTGVNKKLFHDYIKVSDVVEKSEIKDFISIEDEEYAWILKSLKEDRIIIHKEDKRIYSICIPLSQLAFILIPKVTIMNIKKLEHRIEILYLILPALRQVKEKLTNYSWKQCLLLENLRSKYGNRRIDQKAGCIFLDIDKYSEYNEKYGNCFSSFVSEVYLPSLLRKIGNFAAAEHMSGDELYLVVLKDLIPKGMDIDQAFAETILLCNEFSKNEGANLCLSNGLPALTIKIGATIGLVTIICDEIKVRTAGQAVNEACRLMQYASKGQIILKDDSLTQGLLHNFIVEASLLVLQKKNLIRAISLIPKLNTGKSIEAA